MSDHQITLPEITALHVGLIVNRDLAAKMLAQAEERGIHNPERSKNPVGDIEEYIIQLVSDDIGEKL